jgi:hypothetical protein
MPQVAKHLPSKYEGPEFKPQSTGKKTPKTTDLFAGHRWLTPVILATQRSGGSQLEDSLGK